MDYDQKILRVGHDHELLLLRPKPEQLQLILSSRSAKVMHAYLVEYRRSRTSVSSSCTRLPAVLTKLHTIAASSSAPCVSLPCTPVASLANEPVLPCVACDLDVRIEDICPLVFRIAPEARSRAIAAFTPGFLSSRPSVSSRASGPFDYAFP